MLEARKIPLSQPSEITSPRPSQNHQPQEQPYKKKEKFSFYALLILCILLSVAIISLYSKVVTTNYQIAAAEDRIEELMENQRSLELKVAGLSCLDRIEGIARTQLGMEKERSLNIQTVSHDEIAQ